jgi:hypothetical protein
LGRSLPMQISQSAGVLETHNYRSAWQYFISLRNAVL